MKISKWAWLILFSSIALVIKAKAQASDFSLRRLAELQEGSRLSLNLVDDKLLKNNRREWMMGTAEDGLQCSLIIRSHFDESLLRSLGRIDYIVDQVQNGSSMRASGEVRDYVTIWMKNSNPDLPILGLDCFRITSNSAKPNRRLSFAMVQDLMGSVILFVEPVVSMQDSLLVSQIIAPIGKIRVLQPLRFKAIKEPQDGRYESLSQVIWPGFHRGQLFDSKTVGDPSCRASLDPSFVRLEPYDITLVPGEEFRFWSVVDSIHGERQSIYFTFKSAVSGAQLKIDCSSLQKRFSNFSEIEAQSQSILEWVRLGNN